MMSLILIKNNTYWDAFLHAFSAAIFLGFKAFLLQLQSTNPAHRHWQTVNVCKQLPRRRTVSSRDSTTLPISLTPRIVLQLSIALRSVANHHHLWSSIRHKRAIMQWVQFQNFPSGLCHRGDGHQHGWFLAVPINFKIGKQHCRFPPFNDLGFVFCQLNKLILVERWAGKRPKDVYDSIH